MPILVTCKSCGNQIKAPDHVGGRTLRCHKCLNPFTVPTMAPAPAPMAPFSPALAPVAKKPLAEEFELPQEAPLDLPPPPVPVEEPLLLEEAPTDDFDQPPPEKEPSTEDIAWEDDAQTAKQSQNRAAAQPPGELGGDVEEMWPTSAMLEHVEITVKEKKGLINLSFIPRARRFNIYEPTTKAPLGHARYELGLLYYLLRPIGFHVFLTQWIAVRERDEKGPVLCWLRQKYSLLSFMQKIAIYTPDKKVMLGYFKTKLFSMLGGFWLYDTNHQQIAEVKPNFGLLGVKHKGELPRYNFETAAGRVLGHVTGEGLAAGGKGKKVFFSFGKPGMTLVVDPDMAEETRVKVLLLATNILMVARGVGRQLSS